MNQVKAMQVFVRCVERGSFSAVAQEFDTTQPSISKLVAALETHLGGSLLERGAGGVRLTGQGQQYYLRCKDIVEAIAAAEAGFGDSRDRVSGVVRISASLPFGRWQLMPHLPALMRLHPALDVDLQLNDRMVDLVAEGIDLAFRFGPLRDSKLLARRIGTSRRATVASPEYLRGHPAPERPQDLAAHECIRFDGGEALSTWRYLPDAGAGAGAGQGAVRVAVQGRIRTNGPESAHAAALAGLGVAQLSRWMIGDDLAAGRLVPLLPAYRLGETPIHAVSPRSTRQAAKVRAVNEFFTDVFRRDPLIGAGTLLNERRAG
jgi:DNA-binding transcriptional LysR family regulator